MIENAHRKYLDYNKETNSFTYIFFTFNEKRTQNLLIGVIIISLRNSDW